MLTQENVSFPVCYSPPISNFKLCSKLKKRGPVAPATSPAVRTVIARILQPTPQFLLENPPLRGLSFLGLAKIPYNIPHWRQTMEPDVPADLDGSNDAPLSSSLSDHNSTPTPQVLIDESPPELETLVASSIEGSRKLDTRMETVTKERQDLEQKLEEFSKHRDSLELGIEILQRQIAALDDTRSELSELQSHDRSLRGNITHLSNSVDGLHARLARLENSVQYMKSVAPAWDPVVAEKDSDAVSEDFAFRFGKDHAVTVIGNPKDADNKDKAAKQKAAKEKAAKEKAAKEKAAKEKAAKEKTAKEKASKEKAVKEKAAKEKAVKVKAAKEEEAREKAHSPAPSQRAARQTRTWYEKIPQGLGFRL